MTDGHRALAALLAPVVDARTASIMAEDDPGFFERTAVELVPLPRWWPLADAVREVLEEAVDGTDEWFAWEDHVRDGLGACCPLVSWRQIVVRPLVPATARQSQFADAFQRIYMSATLGAGGELERIFGVRDRAYARTGGVGTALDRPAPVPSPRRFAAAQCDGETVSDAVVAAGRALVLAPTHEAVAARRQVLEQAGVPTLSASDVEKASTRSRPVNGPPWCWRIATTGSTCPARLAGCSCSTGSR